MFLTRTRGEVDYQHYLNAITTQVIETWRNQNIVSHDAWVWPRAQICAEFKYLDRRGVYWRTFVRSERHLRARHGRAIPYHCLATFNLRYAFFERAFCELTQFWSRIESPRGFTVELPPVFTHRMRELMDPSSGWWVVAYTEQAIKTAVYILMDVYFNLRLWSVSPHLARALGELNLDAALGCAANVAEFRRLLGVIESTDFSSKPSSWTFRGDENARVGAHQNRRGWGRQGPGADFIYYDPWRQVEISAEQAKQILRGERRRIPDGHPVGWDHSSIPDEGWAPPALSSAVEEMNGTGWAADVPEEVVTTVPGRSVSSQGPSYDPSSSVVAPNVAAAPVNNVLDSTRDAHLEGMREMLRVMGNFPDSILNSSYKEVILAFFRGRMSQGHSGGGPGGSPGDIYLGVLFDSWRASSCCRLS